MEITQEEGDCLVTLDGVTRRVEDCKALKLGNTLYDKDGDKYTEEEMEGFGFRYRT